MPDPRGLGRAQFVGVLALSYLAFLFLHGPVWRRPFQVERSIIDSYLVIPPLVLACLAWSRRLALRPFLLDTLLVTLAKFGLTVTTMTLIWGLSGGPPAPAAPAPVAVSDTAPRHHLVARPGDPRLGAPPAPPLALDNRGRGFEPHAAEVRVGQALVLASRDGRLHTLEARRGGEQLFNVPVLAAPATIHLLEPVGAVTLRCRAHPDEPTSTLVVKP